MTIQLPESKLTKHQVTTFTASNVEYQGELYKSVVATVRYDDQCGNGHNTFSITGDAWLDGKPMRRNDPDMCGCIHELLAVAFPHLAGLIKWHLVSSDGPLHYIANTRYHARTCTHEGKQPGDAVKFATRLKFSGFPMTFEEQCAGFWDWMDEQALKHVSSIDVREVPKKHDDHIYSPNYSFEGFKSTRNLNGDEWYDTPFKSRRQAEEWAACMMGNSWERVQEPVAWAKAVEPNIEAARNCAKWPEATLEQLQSEEELQARLPSLMVEFKAAIESLGFTY